jgi:uncharacterized protein (DUF885 family)
MTPQLSRRSLLLAAGSAGLLAALPQGAAFAQPAGKAGALNALFDVFMQEGLHNDPRVATSLGLDVGALQPLRHRMPDLSLQGVAATRRLRASQLERLQGLGPDGLSGLDLVNYQAVHYGIQAAADADRAFDIGVGGASSPYVMTQVSGAYYDVPDFLDTRQPIKSADDAEAYLDRLKGFALLLDQDGERFRYGASKGMVPPDFILDKTLEQLNALVTADPAASNLVASLARRAREAGVSGDPAGRAAAIYVQDVRPALGRLIDQVRALRARASHAAGVGARPRGTEWYALALRSYTTSSMSPQEVHRVGLEQTRAYQAQIDQILKGQGLTQGSVGARIQALSQDPRYLWPDTDAGKEELVAHLNDLVAAITPRLTRMFHKPPTIPLQIRRVPKTIEAGAPLGYYQSATLDGSRPAFYYINLHHTADWPKWLVPSVTFHEGVPGHHLQISTAQHLEGLPLLRRTSGNSGYQEGWALYAEQLADELGMYETDPLGRVGYLKSELWRACRMVLDTGVHTMGWSREQAIRWKMDNDGSLESGAINEVERYCAWPGQAPSYKIGHTVINRVRDQARAKLGARFDIRDFHDAVLGSGAVPLDLLPGVVGV